MRWGGMGAPPDTSAVAAGTRTGRSPDAPAVACAAGTPTSSALWAGRTAVLAAVAVATLTLRAAGSGITGGLLADTWQLLDIEVLAADPLGSVWYLHTQPPGYNLLVGIVAWLPLPVAGTLFAIDIAALAGIGLLLHQILVRRGLGSAAAAVVATVAVLNPSLLNTIGLASYEVLVCLLAVGALATAQRFLDDSGTAALLATSALLTAAALVRSLLHPAWVLAVVALLLVARPPGRRAALASLAIPVVLLGGWMVKNQVVFGTATTSSWLGFNMQRGVVAPMDADLVEDEVTRGNVSALALEPPWDAPERYREWIGDCSPHDHPATSEVSKEPAGWTTTNFNYECYLPVYRQAQRDAFTLVRRHPGDYLTHRVTALTFSFVHSSSLPGGDTTWLDTVYAPVLLSVDRDVSQDGWNIPLFGVAQDIPVRVSLTLAALCAFVLGRGVLSVVRLARHGWRDRRDWPTSEVLWLLVTSTVAVVVLGGDLVEIGENTRFRAMVDPLLIAFPLASLLLALRLRTQADETDPAAEQALAS
jgi:hypothetical protein